MTLRDSLSHFRSWRLWLLLGAILSLTFVHQISGGQISRYQEVLDILPYILIMAGAMWFGLTGAVTTAVLTSVCYTIHLTVHEEGGLFDPRNFHRILNIFMYLIVGVFTGFLAQRQLEALRRHKSVAEKLDESYRQLRARTDELFRAEEDIQRANRLSAVGQLAAGLAHEVGNPLGGIKGAAEILADRTRQDTEGQRFAELLLKEVGRLDTVVSRFLDSVRHGDSRDTEAVLSDVLDSVLSLSKRTIETQGLHVLVDIEDGLPAVAADPQQLYQVFLNLLLNAIQATPEGGTIAFRARKTDEGITCSVSDTGHGISSEDIPRIFDPFFTSRARGTGLGLAITHKILDSCKGRIAVDSRPGEGATFRVTLPVSTSHDSDQGPRR